MTFEASPEKAFPGAAAQNSACKVGLERAMRGSASLPSIRTDPDIYATTVSMTLSCKAIIFDLDGVLVDSDAAIRQRWRQWAERRNVPFEEVEAVYIGRPVEGVIQEVAPHLDPEDEIERMKEEVTLDPDSLSAFDGAAALLERLPEDRWTIATSGRRRTATSRLSHVGLPIPETLVTADDVDRGKPAPDPYQLAADRLGVEPGHCVVVEDASVGVEAAWRAGAPVIAVATTQDPDALAAATVVVPRIEDLTVRANGEGLLVEWRTQVRATDASQQRDGTTE